MTDQDRINRNWARHLAEQRASPNPNPPVSAFARLAALVKAKTNDEECEDDTVTDDDDKDKKDPMKKKKPKKPVDDGDGDEGDDDDRPSTRVLDPRAAVLDPKAAKALAANVVRCGKIRRGEIPDDRKPTDEAGQKAAQIIAAGKKRRGEI